MPVVTGLLTAASERARGREREVLFEREPCGTRTGVVWR